VESKWKKLPHYNFSWTVSPQKIRRKEGQLDDLKETRRYWKLKEEAQDRTPWRTQFGKGYGPVAR
jgi:hypothetical protein